MIISIVPENNLTNSNTDSGHNNKTGIEENYSVLLKSVYKIDITLNDA